VLLLEVFQCIPIGIAVENRAGTPPPGSLNVTTLLAKVCRLHWRHTQAGVYHTPDLQPINFNLVWIFFPVSTVCGRRKRRAWENVYGVFPFEVPLVRKFSVGNSLELPLLLRCLWIAEESDFFLHRLIILSYKYIELLGAIPALVEYNESYNLTFLHMSQ